MLFGAGLIGASEYRLAIDEEWSLYRSYLKPKVSDFPLLAAPEKLPSSVATAKGRLFLRLLDLRIQGYTGGSRSLWDVIRTGAATGQGWTLRGALERASEEWNLPLIPLYIRYAEKGGTILPADLWETMVFVDGQRLAVDVAPTIIRGRTVVPLRAIFEALGAEVKWDAGTSRVTAIKDGRTVILTVGSLRAQVDDKHYLLDAAPIISNGRVLVPLRFSGEAFGAEVAWEAETLKILLTSGMGTPVSFPEFTGYSPVAGRLQGGGDDAPVAYLTFDDGPTRKVTPMVLDILARYNVKGTFFVIGTRVQDLPELTRRIVREGHALGNHTWNHDYSDIYRSPEVFLASVRRAEESLFQIAGVRPDIVRAPGGTFGHFTPEYFAIMKQNGYAVINWNVSSGDTTLPVPPADVIAANVIENAKPKSVRKNAVILLHDGAGHESSAEALPTIIEYFLSLGYRFEVLTPDNPLAK
jgi:peptidoglycan/xylan/chitin deacetylase (PgdA/CDA1 family)